MPLNLLSMRILRDLTRNRWPSARRKNHDNTTTSPSQAHSMTEWSNTVLSAISRLPPELIDEIMCFLPASSEIAFRRCNKQLYINGGPKPLNLLYSNLRNGKDKDDHLWLLCLLERDTRQRLVCSICIAIHEKNFFNAAEMSKSSKSRKCRRVHICPHRSLTFPQLQRIISGCSTLHGNPQKQPLNCTDEDCIIDEPGVNCERSVQLNLDLEHCSTTWSYNRVWKRGLHLSTAWVIFSGESICPQRSEGSLAWTWRLCPHVTMKDCCDCCQVNNPGRIKLDLRYGEPHSRVRNGRVLRCKLCCTRINTSEVVGLRSRRVRRVVIVDKYLGRGKSVEDVDWLRQTTPKATRQRSRQQSKGGRLGAVAAYCSAIIGDLWPGPY